MAVPLEFRNALVMKVKSELDDYEEFVNSVLSNREKRMRFIQNPTATMIKAGLLPKRSKAQISLANRVFFHIVANRRLTEWMQRNTPKDLFTEEDLRAMQAEIRRRGRVSFNNQRTLKLVKAVMAHEDYMRGVMRILLQDKAVRGSLPPKIRRMSPRAQEKKIFDSMRNITTVDQLDEFFGDNPSMFAITVPLIYSTAVVMTSVGVYSSIVLFTTVYFWVDVRTGTGTGTGSGTDTQASTDTQTDTQAATVSDTQTQTDTQTGSGTQTDTQSQTATATSTDTSTGSGTDTSTGSDTSTSSDSSTSSSSDSSTGSDTQTNTSTSGIYGKLGDLNEAELGYLVNMSVLSDLLQATAAQQIEG